MFYTYLKLNIFLHFVCRFLNEGKKRDENLFLFPLRESELLKYLVIHLTKIFQDESKKTIFLGYTLYYVFHDKHSAQSAGTCNSGFKNEAWHIQ